MTSVRSVRMLRAGLCDVDASMLAGRAEPSGRFLKLPIWMYLVETDNGAFCVDSGMPAGCAGNPDYFRREGCGEPMIRPDMDPDDAAAAVLERAGVRPQDCAALVTTHLHFDHAGGQEAFRGVPVLLHEKEAELGRSGRCLPECFPEGLDYRPFSGDREVVPGFTLLHTPGHAPGHLSLLVEPPQGPPVLITVDATYTRENWEGAPGAWYDEAAGRASVARLREVARDTGARVFFGHDLEQAASEEWRPFMAPGPRR